MDDFVDAPMLKIGVAEGGVHEAGARGEGGDEFVEVEGGLVGPIIFQAGHVALAGPAGDVAVVVIAEGIEAATGDDDLDAGVEHGGVDGVVSAEGMADRAERAAFHEGERFEEIEAAHIVPDGFHGAALVTEGFEIGLVIGHERIGGREDDVAAFGEFDAVTAVRRAEADDGLVAELHVGRVQAKDGGKFVFLGRDFGNEQIRGDA